MNVIKQDPKHTGQSQKTPAVKQAEEFEAMITARGLHQAREKA